MKHQFIILVLTLISCTTNTSSTDSNKNEEHKKPKSLQVLLIGSSHWNNYQSKGLDVAQTNEIDILSDEYQKDLDQIVEAIKEFGPDKIFVERTINYQSKLDSLYNLYQTTDWGKEKRNEIYQLGFKVAKTLGHKQVYGIDHRGTSFPYDSLMQAMEKAKQTKLIASFVDDLKQYEENYNKLVAEKKPLKNILYFLNDKKHRKLDLGWYLNNANKGGSINNNIGSFLTSEWIKRNIYTYGLIQKYVEPKDQRIMILMGAGHIAPLENFISYNPHWAVVELKEIME